MYFKVIWPGKTKDSHIRGLQEAYFERINHLVRCELFETKTARGIPEREAEKIKQAESLALEKHLKDDYIICLLDRGNEMNSKQLAAFLDQKMMGRQHAISFVMGGFLGLSDHLLQKADFALSLSRMTYSHELARLLLLEQIYRALSIIKGKHYAK